MAALIEYAVKCELLSEICEYIEIKDGNGMFRLWGKIFKDNRMIRDTVIIKKDETVTRTNKVLSAVEDICYEFDLGKPIWLNANIAEFKRHSKVRFKQDSFIEEIDFDYLEIQVIEE